LPITQLPEIPKRNCRNFDPVCHKQSQCLNPMICETRRKRVETKPATAAVMLRRLLRGCVIASDLLRRIVGARGG